ncbi:PREDICTED: oxysterol-binding protein-related protein 8 [Dipodomys ordii]|uniref:Oxysterol-binding protein n=1 Tax=Dipodomys ordii TaxID=10020 RepID=A0A1S3FCJ0_DIPOR|nr:PREDICTED: oxysterol-binding protein-related protein 8 [Dipodomys ordii]
METGLSDGEPDRTSILPYSEVAEVQETLGDSKDILGQSTIVANSDESQVLTPGKMNQRQGKESYSTPTKDLHQPSLSPASPHSQGFERGKEDISQNKDESSLSMSKSKSESKLYNGSEKESSTSSKLTKKESLKVQKKNYREEKKRATKELLSTITDPSVIVMADWLKGPKGEAVGSITQPLPSSYLIIRATSESDGRCWMDALELALKCSSLLKRTMIREGKEHDLSVSSDNTHVTLYGLLRANNLHSGDNFQLNDSEIDRQHFKDQDMYSDKSDKENDQEHDESDNEVLGKSEESDTDTSERQDDSYIEPEPVEPLKETTYTEQSHEELGEAGEASQTETVSEENKSLIWTLLKQVRPGMDLSRVVLPTFILEPRSFLDKLSDYYYHADFLSEAALEENPYFRLKKVVKWYLSGFYKKPKGLKKPYNPILGETFRCLWIHPRTSSKTFYIAEQVSHHPPISAFYVSNRKDGFCLSGSILAKSKFYGNSLSAILEGEARLTFLNRGEDYVMTMPYAHCKGILYGTMTLELGGTVNITCQKTGYSAILEFKLKPFLGSSDCVNQISGKLKLGKEVLATLEGHWDSEVFINDKKTDNSEVFWNPTPDIRQWRLIRHTVKFEEQEDFESEKLWQRVTRAINAKDQTEATQEKCVLEEAQRQAARDRKTKNEEWTCKLFELDALTGEWHYRFADTRPWDPLNDMIQFEKDGVIQTKVKHRTPMVNVPKMKHKPTRQQKKVTKGYSSPEPDIQDSSGSETQSVKPSTRRKKGIELGDIQNSIESIKQTQEDIKRNIMALRNHLVPSTPATDYFLQQKDYFIIFLLILLQVIINFMFK